ncbi:Gfo/Idh/MocA family protein [Conservatibacter flavescens]|uniref:Gfo/Idh/MocA family oxidoreductase n=1 Tax=Conservatibacter flavescens TaxID=28161 RepID=A0A2M8S2K7_9PAST|nr:Gfo/Idh/MocA family oxidoreductase [Conservatibacter flavescens]PJG85391.1 gfo/Idh/MocA family oxidoreductase [Conservatibacter flavescens]
MNKTKIALIGCGFFGKQLAYSFNKLNTVLVGFVDLNIDRAHQLAEKYGSQAYENIHALLENTQPDLVIISTFNYAHREPAIAALNHNAHVFIETPFTIDQQECREIVELANAKNKTLFIGHLLRTLPGVIKAKQFLDENKLGKITVARATRQRWIDSSPNKDWWKNNIALTGGKLFNEIHELDLLCWLLGDVDSVYAQSTNRAHPDNLENHDIFQLLLQFKSGIFASLEMGTAYRLHEWSITIHGELGALVINFFNSTMTLTLANGQRQQFNLYDEFEADLSLRESGKAIQRYNELNAIVPLWLSRATEIEAQTILDHLNEGKESVLTQQTMDAVIVADAARESIKQKKQIDVICK